MTVKIPSHPDSRLKQIAEVLKKYSAAHPRARIEVYRQNSVSVRIRILAAEFEGMSRAQREDELWNLFQQLPEEVAAEISLLLLLTPQEAKNSIANFEFDNPIPSEL